MKTSLLKVLLAGLVAIIGRPQTVHAAMSVRFEPQAIVVSGVTPGARIIVFGVVNEPANHSIRVSREFKLLTDEDRDGVVKWDFSPKQMPRRSSWAVADLDRGDVITASPQTIRVKSIPIDLSSLKKDNAGQIKKLEVPRGVIEMLLVRPADGTAWYGSYAQGGKLDDDGSNNGKLLMSFDRLAPIVPGKDRGDHLKKGDVVVVIDRRTLDSAMIQVGKD